MTSLCASQSHVPNSPRLPTTGLRRAMYDWKSSAHGQQGYSFAKSPTKPARSDCCVAEGASGYCAAMEWRSVQELRPSASESGGQSGAGFAALRVDFVWEAQEAKEVQLRQL